jgi:hypothetical protein
LDLGDCVLEFFYFLNKILVLIRFLVQEGIDTLLLLQQEQELIVDIDTLGSCLQVLINDLFDGVLSILDDLIIR